ncbi:MAG: hypothetical protein MHPSP_001046 [Paramarteilia canceri]
MIYIKMELKFATMIDEDEGFSKAQLNDQSNKELISKGIIVEEVLKHMMESIDYIENIDKQNLVEEYPNFADILYKWYFPSE